MSEETTPQAPNWLQMARAAFTESTTYFDSSIRKQIEAGLLQFQGVHPKGSKYFQDNYKARSRLFRPKTRTTIRKNEAVAAEALFSTTDVVSITPEDDGEVVQRASAVFYHEVMNYRLQKTIPWFLTCIGAYQDTQTVGVALSRQYWKYDAKKGIDKPCIDLLPVENLRIAPGADWLDPINSSPYVIWMIPMYVKDVRARMRTIDKRTNAPKWKTLSDHHILTAINSSSDSTRQTRERGRTDSKEQATAINDFAIVWVHENIVEVDGEDLIFHTLGTVGMLTDPVPISKVYHHGVRPFVMGYCVIETHKAYPDGVTGLTKDVQAEVNEVTNQRLDNVKFAMNKRYLATRKSQIDVRSLTRNVPGSVTFLNDIEKDIKVMETADVTSSSFQEQDRLNQDFDDVSGSFSQASIASNRRLNETVGGLNLLSTNANQVGSYQLKTFVETWVEPVLRQVLLLEQYYETDEVILALAGRKAAALVQRFGQSVTLDQLLAQELTLNVNVGIGATNPQERVNNFLKAMTALKEMLADGTLERYGLDVREVIAEMFGKLGYKDGSRFFGGDEVDPRMVAAQNTIQELQQELAQKVSPELVAAQIRKIDADIELLGAKTKDAVAASVEKYLRAFFSSGQLAQLIAAIPGLAPIADGLVQAAGYTPQGGTDPNFQQPMAPAPQIALNPVKDPRIGTEFMPGMAADTTPSTPADPATALEGANQGIETLQADS